MSLSDDAITNLYRVRKTLLEMLNDRGYLVTDDEINMTREQFLARFGENMKRQDLFIHTNKRNDSSDQIFVFFVAPETATPKVGVGPIKKCVNKMVSENVDKAILVAQHGFTPPAIKATQVTKSAMETFLDAELLINVSNHILVPKHQVLEDEEKNTLLQKYKVKDQQLPRILVSDPMARYYGARRGQIMKITRKSENAGEYVTFRLVC